MDSHVHFSDQSHYMFQETQQSPLNCLHTSLLPIMRGCMQGITILTIVHTPPPLLTPPGCPPPLLPVENFPNSVAAPNIPELNLASHLLLFNPPHLLSNFLSHSTPQTLPLIIFIPSSLISPVPSMVEGLALENLFAVTAKILS